ncbi:MAG TPA: nuclear pore complex subunit [Marinilabiliales bacterium]|jgi:hypothetical protein|nr:MAG: hypothetical protein A2W95_11795 [Bacteroidetes bacterium GWA2_40_14]OFX58634.1 MAG: hypothetical protein A2W84_10865 [Bacteroidetes bacterium GWC2_40_13]OFX75418.1 MAG: hypothetical protein A2W96_13370 [Bacteroidetes bacterium GWD2_40_43]OFX91956.1 MAG: hypothetical protein A2W97_15680 [Bacteroidetes bacterium GWE2_40_63]OFY24627.1 MAG: hypothetical protein A2W88_11105 [Bacteroidetes bacterium GWF2_40_13]OFZ26869.1 MAG: hypothetical protein A2437_08270 [Bacteroidetes bacterium RIFOXYC
MEPLHAKETTSTPKVYFDPDQNLFEIKGCSRPEDVRDFYVPVITWLEKFRLSINDDFRAKYTGSPLVFRFKFDYFNSSSAKFILDMLVLINQMHANGLNVNIHWFYDQNDEDMREVGEELSEVVDFPFEYVEVKKTAF